MYASYKGYLNVVRTLLDGGADINAKNKVRNQIIIIMMMMMMLAMIVINDEDRDDCR